MLVRSLSGGQTIKWCVKQDRISLNSDKLLLKSSGLLWVVGSYSLESLG